MMLTADRWGSPGSGEWLIFKLGEEVIFGAALFWVTSAMAGVDSVSNSPTSI